MADKTFLDRVDQYLPYTFSQFEETLNGVHFLQKEKRTSCLKEVLIRAPLIPCDMLWRLSTNGAKLARGIGKLGGRTLTLSWNFSSNKAKWNKIFFEDIDLLIATLLSPLQGFAKIMRLSIGIFSPKSFFNQADSLIMRRQLDLLIPSLETRMRKDFKQTIVIKKFEKIWARPAFNRCGKRHLPGYALDIDKLALLTIVNVLFQYSCRYQLINTNARSKTFKASIQSHFGRLFDSITDPKKFLKKRIKLADDQRKMSSVPQDSIERKYALFLVFQQLTENWKKTPALIEKSSLQTFISENFKTEHQKQVLQIFLKKVPKEDDSKHLKYLKHYQTNKIGGIVGKSFYSQFYACACKKNGKLLQRKMIAKMHKSILDSARFS